MKVQISIIFIAIIFSCSTDKKTKINFKVNSKNEFVNSSKKQKVNIKNECNFENDIYKFTSEAIKKFDSKIIYQWDDKEKKALLKLDNGDTLILQIGGCYHFNYLAEFRTDKSKFNNNEYLLEKTRWIARNFFNNGFENYDKFILNKEYTLVVDELNYKSYNVISDKLITQENRIFDGFTFEIVNNRTKIEILGYVN